MPPTFGSRVAGEAAYLKAVEEHKGGAEVFGKRVRGSLTPATADVIAKQNSEFGFRTVDKATFQDHRGERVDAVALEDLQEILNENPTFFDSLYEAEMARAVGPRKEALRIFAVVEQGIKGAGRAHIIEEINAHLGIPQQQAKAQAEDLRKKIENYKAMEAREQENVGLLDADRLTKITEREENLEKLRKSDSPTVKAAIEKIDEAEKLAKHPPKEKEGGDKREQAGPSVEAETAEAGGGMAGAGKSHKGEGRKGKGKK